MNTRTWQSALIQLLVLIPAAASCYLPAKNQMKYSPLKTILICAAAIIPYILAASWLYVAFRFDTSYMLMLFLPLFFFLYRGTLNIDLSKALAIYVGVCTVQSFPAQFAYAFDAHLNPTSGAANLSVEAAMFQLGFACLMPILFAYPSRHQLTWAIDQLDFPKVWYSTVMLSGIFLVLNISFIPHSYSTLWAGRLSYLFPLMELCALALLIVIYILFYRAATIILEHAKLKERAQLLEMQSHQYYALQNYMKLTTRLRHDFRHSVYLLASLAEKGDLDSIRTHLNAYEIRLVENTPATYCANAALNALFGYYHEMAVSAGINTDWNILLPEPLTVSELDMAALFGNLMENAIAACISVPKEKRYFSLTSEIRHGNSLYIVSTNSFDGSVRKAKDGYHSTKHSGTGTGLVSITAIAEKYGGSAHASNNEQEFFVDVILKL